MEKLIQEPKQPTTKLMEKGSMPASNSFEVGRSFCSPPAFASVARLALCFIPETLASRLMLALVPFKTFGDDWVTLLDDGSPGCKRVILTNPSAQPMTFEVTWAGETPPLTQIVRPHISMMLSAR